ncbi:transposase [Rhizobium leguminosarum]|nr:transposase [Rhizobium leguminosarum]
MIARGLLQDRMHVAAMVAGVRQPDRFAAVHRIGSMIPSDLFGYFIQLTQHLLALICDRHSMDQQREFLTSRKSGREVHRHWPDEVKAQIVSESLRPGAKVNEVAERFGLRANRLSSWRTMARQGKLVLPAPEDAVEFAAVIVDPPVSEPLINKTSRPAIIVGSVTIRLEEGASATRIAAVALACAVPA